MWRLDNDKDGKRIYKNATTGSECTQTMCYTDKEGNQWWNFDDLRNIPETRIFVTEKISKLFLVNLTIFDLRKFATSFKTMLRSKDNGEKYEKCYNEVMQFESIFENAADPLRQLNALVPIYFTMNDEEIDSFVNDLQLKKMSIIEADMQMHAFFLKRQSYAMADYINFLDRIFRTASALENGTLIPTQ